jgi:hypothetical protein
MRHCLCDRQISLSVLDLTAHRLIPDEINDPPPDCVCVHGRRDRRSPLDPSPVAPLTPHDLVALLKGAFAFAIFTLGFLFAGVRPHIVAPIGCRAEPPQCLRCTAALPEDCVDISSSWSAGKWWCADIRMRSWAAAAVPPVMPAMASRARAAGRHRRRGRARSGRSGNPRPCGG